MHERPYGASLRTGARCGGAHSALACVRQRTAHARATRRRRRVHASWSYHALLGLLRLWFLGFAGEFLHARRCRLRSSLLLTELGAFAPVPRSITAPTGVFMLALLQTHVSQHRP